MSTKLYFHVNANALSGIFPTGEQGASSASFTAVGANTLRTMDRSIGTSQTSLSFTGATDSTRNFMGFFSSPPFNRTQTVGGNVMEILVASSESDLGANFWINSLTVYVWRPSTGTKVGQLLDNSTGNSLGGAEPLTANNAYPDYITSIASAQVNASVGDVIICEVWNTVATGSIIPYTCSFYFDGTIETTNQSTIVTSQASYIKFSETLSFDGDPLIRPHSFGAVI